MWSKQKNQIFACIALSIRNLSQTCKICIQTPNNLHLHREKDFHFDIWRWKHLNAQCLSSTFIDDHHKTRVLGPIGLYIWARTWGWVKISNVNVRDWNGVTIEPKFHPVSSLYTLKGRSAELLVFYHFLLHLCFCETPDKCSRQFSLNMWLTHLSLFFRHNPKLPPRIHAIYIPTTHFCVEHWLHCILILRPQPHPPQQLVLLQRLLHLLLLPHGQPDPLHQSVHRAELGRVFHGDLSKGVVKLKPTSHCHCLPDYQHCQASHRCCHLSANLNRCLCLFVCLFVCFSLPADWTSLRSAWRLTLVRSSAATFITSASRPAYYQCHAIMYHAKYDYTTPSYFILSNHGISSNTLLPCEICIQSSNQNCP